MLWTLEKPEERVAVYVVTPLEGAILDVPECEVDFVRQDSVKRVKAKRPATLEEHVRGLPCGERRRINAYTIRSYDLSKRTWLVDFYEFNKARAKRSWENML